MRYARTDLRCRWKDSQSRQCPVRGLNGFTLIELLVVVSIMLIISAFVVASFRANSGPDRIRAGARQLQSALLGAKDRAIRFKELRGVRLLLDTADANIVTGLAYIGAPTPWSNGTVILGRPDSSPQDGFADSDTVRYLRGYGTGWSALYSRGLLINGSRIQIPTGGRW